MNLRKPTTASLALQYAILAIGLTFAIFPIYFVAQAALRPGNTLYSTELQLLPTDASLEHFTTILTTRTDELNLPLWLWNSVKVAALTTIVTLIVTVTGGYALSRFKFRGRGSLLTSMLGLQAFPAALALPAYYLLLSQFNLLNNHFGLILVYAAGAIVFNVWNLKGYFDTIPIDLEEAATIDGATPTQAFFMVMLPLARPAIAVTALFGFLAGFGDFIVAQTVLFDPDLYTATVGIFTLQEGYRTPWGLFAASALIVSVPVTVLFLYLQRNLVGGLSAGGVKG
ncbi:MAG: sugar ABC transporter permease [Roseiflexaceae bacterium]|nr:sugar ABC transporter permease [Roseiflexaceae bacterium]